MSRNPDIIRRPSRRGEFSSGGGAAPPAPFTEIHGFITPDISNYYLHTPASTTGPNFGAQDGTIAMVVRLTTANISGQHHIINRITTAVGGYMISIGGDETATLYIVDTGGTTRTINNATALLTTGLNLVVGRFTATTLDLRVNGVDATQVALSLPWQPLGSSTIGLGINNSATAAHCDQVIIYTLGTSTSRLSDAQVDTWTAEIKNYGMTAAPVGADYVYKYPGGSPATFSPDLGTPGDFTETGATTGDTYTNTWAF